MRQRSLLTQVLLVNLLLVVVTVLVAVLAGAGGTMSRGREALVAPLGVAGTLLGNWLLLRRRFAPLETLLQTMEAIDLADPDPARLGPPGQTSEVRRLDTTLRRLITRLQDERREAGRAVVEAQERERRRIAQDLHDEVNQALTAVSLRLQASISEAPPHLQDELADTKELVGQAMRELLSLARQLRPSVLDDHGLVPALRTQVREFGQSARLEATLEVTGSDPHLAPERELAIYRICQESLSNVSHHASASRVDVALHTDCPIRLTVTDDGCGFDPGAGVPGGRLGLSGMRERALLAGGRLAVSSSPSQGTTVELILD